MLLQLTISACSLFISAIVGGIVGYWGFRKRKRALFEEGSKLYIQQIPFAAYCRYAEVRQTTISQVHRHIWFWGILMPLPALFGELLANFIIRHNISSQPFIEIATRSALVGLVIGVGLFEFFSDVRLDLPAIRLFLESQFERSRFIMCNIRQRLFSFLSYFLLLLIGVMYLSIYPTSFSLYQVLLPLYLIFKVFGNIGSLPWLVTLVVLLILLRLFLNIFALQYARLTASLQPLEHTQWTFLAPRILAWCQRTGVEFASVMVAKDLINRQAVRLAGLGGRPTLIISEALLRTGEWRQYDTFICQAIAMYKRFTPQKRLLRDVLALNILIAWLAIAPITSMFPASPARDIICNILFIGLGITGLATYTLLSEQNTHVTDDSVLQLTGDPLALITVHHVRATLNGEPIKLITSDAITKNDQMQRLVDKVHTLWPHAPYANMPVPSPLKIRIAHEPITIPLNQATPPAPVPEATYENFAS